MRFKQAVMEYSLKHGVTTAAIRYKTSRQNIYRWRKKYDERVHKGLHPVSACGIKRPTRKAASRLREKAKHHGIQPLNVDSMVFFDGGE